MAGIAMETLSLKDQPTQSMQSPFLDLPRELRDSIYKHVFGPRRSLTLHGIRKYHQYFPTRLNLLRTCTKIHDEASQILWEVNTLRLVAHDASLWPEDDRPVTDFFKLIKPSWADLVRKVELVLIFSPGECESARSYLPFLAEWAKNGTLKEMVLTGYGATNFRQVMDCWKYTEENPVDTYSRPGKYLTLFQLMQEAGVSEHKGLFAQCKLRRRLNVHLDGLHKVNGLGTGWMYSPINDDYHDAMDEMHEYIGADLYASGILGFKNGKRLRTLVRRVDPRREKIVDPPSPFRSWYCVPKRKRDALKLIRKRCYEYVRIWEGIALEDDSVDWDLVWRVTLWDKLEEAMPFLSAGPPCLS